MLNRREDNDQSIWIEKKTAYGNATYCLTLCIDNVSNPVTLQDLIYLRNLLEDVISTEGGTANSEYGSSYLSKPWFQHEIDRLTRQERYEHAAQLTQLRQAVMKAEKIIEKPLFALFDGKASRKEISKFRL